MVTANRSTVIEALAANRPEDLIGLAESSVVDFKSTPYAVDTDRGKFELCKDVAAFANAQGGLLVLGVETEKDADQALEIVKALHPFSQNRADVHRYIDILNEYLRPRLIISHRWYPNPSSIKLEKGTNFYLVLEVDPVPEPVRYVIVRRILNARGMFAEGLTVPLRHGDRTVYLPSEDAYQLINDGLRSREIATGDRWMLSSRSLLGDDLDQIAEKTLDDLEQHEEWDSTPILYWQSIPPRSGRIISDLHSQGGIRGGLQNQRVLRDNGFNFRDALGKLDVYEGGLILSRRRCALWVLPEGLVTAGAVATPDMLCWAMEQRGVPNRLNTFVLTEMTLEYFRIVYNLLIRRQPGTWAHRIVARRFQGELPRSLGPGGTGYAQFLSEAHNASADTWDRSWPATGDPERDAFEALRLIYTLFGVDVSTNPDVQGNRVSTEQISNA